MSGSPSASVVGVGNTPISGGAKGSFTILARSARGIGIVEAQVEGLARLGQREVPAALGAHIEDARQQHALVEDERRTRELERLVTGKPPLSLDLGARQGSRGCRGRPEGQRGVEIDRQRIGAAGGGVDKRQRRLAEELPSIVNVHLGTRW